MEVLGELKFLVSEVPLHPCTTCARASRSDLPRHMRDSAFFRWIGVYTWQKKGRGGGHSMEGDRCPANLKQISQPMPDSGLGPVW